MNLQSSVTKIAFDLLNLVNATSTASDMANAIEELDNIEAACRKTRARWTRAVQALAKQGGLDLPPQGEAKSP